MLADNGVGWVPMKTWVLIVIVALSAASAGAEVQLDLPGLYGDYSIDSSPPGGTLWSRTTTFVLPDSLESFTGLQLHIFGTWTAAQREVCREVLGVVICDTLAKDTKMTLRLTAPSLGECSFEASVYAHAAVFGDELLVDICPVGQADLNSLIGSVVSAELFCDVAPEEIAQLVEPGSGTVSVVQLLTVGAVPTARDSWGSLKSRYR